MALKEKIKLFLEIFKNLKDKSSYEDNFKYQVPSWLDD